MSNNHYNYSISLIRRVDDRWVIDPEDASAQAFQYELSGKAIGDGYLATKTEGELSYCIFLSGDVCHSDIYGWIITLNGWQILDLDTYLHLSREVWKRFAQASLSGHEIRLLLHELMESTGLILSSSPAPIDRNVEHHYQSLNFTPKKKPREPSKTAPSSGVIAFMFAVVFVIIGVCGFCASHIYSDDLRDKEDKDSIAADLVYLDSVILLYGRVDTTNTLFSNYLYALSRQDYSAALSCFEFPVEAFLDRRNLSRGKMSAALKEYNYPNPIHNTYDFKVEPMSDSVVRIAYICDRRVKGRNYPQRSRVTCLVKARKTSENWKIYSVIEENSEPLSVYLSGPEEPVYATPYDGN